MFDLYNSDRTRQQETPKEKQVYLIQNGFPDRLFQHSFKRLLTRE